MLHFQMFVIGETTGKTTKVALIYSRLPFRMKRKILINQIVIFIALLEMTINQRFPKYRAKATPKPLLIAIRLIKQLSID